MADTYTSSLRLRLIETGTRPNTWGTIANTDVFTLADAAIAGTTTKALTTNYTLTSNNGASDEARAAILKFTGTGAYQVTIPSASKTYRVWNGCTGALTLTTGSGDTAVLSAGEITDVLCDGTNVKASGTGSASWKAYIDSVVLPSQTGNSGKVVTTNGTAASWATPQSLLLAPGVPYTGNATITTDGYSVHYNDTATNVILTLDPTIDPGSRMVFYQRNTGTVSVYPGSGVSFHIAAGGPSLGANGGFGLNAQYEGMEAICLFTNRWVFWPLGATTLAGV